MAKHALLSPSSGSIWEKCTPAPRLSLQVEKKSSPYADEGTLAHKISELLILRQLKRLRESEFKIKLALAKAEFPQYYNKGLLSHCQKYCTFVMAAYAKALIKDPHAIILVESTLYFSDYIPESFGTGDIVIIGKGFVWLIDLKYGAGVRVEAEENIQLKIYGIGAIDLSKLFFSEVEEVLLTIYQPRMDNISTWQTTAKEILRWAEEDLKPKAKLAWEGKGELVAGEHCRFCAVLPTCKAAQKDKMKAATNAFKEPMLLTPKEIAAVLKDGPGLKQWITAVEDWALIKAKAGMKFPGWKLVKGKSDTIIKDKKEAVKILKEAGYDLHEIMQLKGITNLKKLLGNDDFYYYLKDILVKPPGAPTLVPESDKRDEHKMSEAATKFFS